MANKNRAQPQRQTAPTMSKSQRRRKRVALGALCLLAAGLLAGALVPQQSPTGPSPVPQSPATIDITDLIESGEFDAGTDG